jgi:hypothetical protein
MRLFNFPISTKRLGTTTTTTATTTITTIIKMTITSTTTMMMIIIIIIITTIIHFTLPRPIMHFTFTCAVSMACCKLKIKTNISAI